MSAGISKTDSIRQALRDGDGPLTKDQVCDAVPDSVDRATVSALLQQRTKAGEFKVEIVDGKPQYSINRHGGKAGTSASTKSLVAPTKTPNAPEAVDVFAAVAAHVAGGSMPAHVGAEVVHPETPNTAPAKTSRVATALQHLCDRMHGISKDLDAALIAAIELDADKTVILELVAARAGVTAALIAGLRH